MVTGSGPCFSVGRHPLRAWDKGAESESQREPLSETLDGLRVADALAGLSLPTLAALNGDALGHGLELALAADLRLAADTARFGLAAPGGGDGPDFPWDGGTQRLPRLVGPAWALDLALTGRTLDATEALTLGLVNRVVPPAQLAAATEQLAQSVLAGAPVAAGYAKEAVGKGLDLTLEQGLRLEADLSVILHGTADRAEGIASFQEHRPPRFSGH